jgi:hypothetical protein
MRAEIRLRARAHVACCNQLSVETITDLTSLETARCAPPLPPMTSPRVQGAAGAHHRARVCNGCVTAERACVRACVGGWVGGWRFDRLRFVPAEEYGHAALAAFSASSPSMSKSKSMPRSSSTGAGQPVIGAHPQGAFWRTGRVGRAQLPALSTDSPLN